MPKGNPREPVICELRRAETRLINAIDKARKAGFEVRADTRGDNSTTWPNVQVFKH